jgi:hypothetical protein
MAKAETFGAVLSKIRKEQGFSGAYQFFKSAGGSKTLGLAFVSYWDMERGKKLPKGWRLKAILAALGVPMHSPKARALVLAYFNELSGSEELAQLLSASSPAGAEQPRTELADIMVQQAVVRRGVHLTPEQWALRSRDLETNFCLSYLVCTAGWVTVAELREATKFKEEAIKKALKALAAGKLVELKGDSARTHLAQKYVQPAPKGAFAQEVRARQRVYWQKWLAEAKLVEKKSLVVRLNKASLDLYRQQLEKAVKLAAVYHNAEENKEDSAVYHISSNIFQIYPKK